MKPASFKYIDARSEAQLAEILAEYGDDAQMLAGGQSLVPMMNFRMVTPAILVDLNHISALSYVELDSDVLRIGALTRHAQVEDSQVIAQHCPLLSAAVRYVAHRMVRNRGTIGGTVALAYPGAEIPLALLTLGAELHLQSQRGERILPLEAFILGALDTEIACDEYIRSFKITLPPKGSAASFIETSRRNGDFAIGAAAVVAARDAEGGLDYLRAGVSGGTGAPIRLTAVEDAVVASDGENRAIADVCREAIEAIEVFGDPHYPEDYRRHLLAGVLMEAVTRAVAKSGEPS